MTKRLLFGAFALLVFSAAMIITQMSCKKEAKADTNPPTGQVGLTQLNTILIYETAPLSSPKELIRVLDLDGKSKGNVVFDLPNNERYAGAKLTPNGKAIILATAPKDQTGKAKLYSLDITGLPNVDHPALVPIYTAFNNETVMQLEGVY